jgi:hypothetical protein
VTPCQTHEIKPISETYIYYKNEKGKPREMDLPFLKNDITTISRL